MAAPVAIITVSGSATIPFADLVAPWPDVTMDLTASTATAPRTITAWRWVLLAGPPGHGATLSAPNAETCILQNIDKVGNYRIFAKVQDSTGEWSFTSPNAIQSGTTPFGFTTPNREAFAVITVTTENLALNKLAYGERNWLESSYWDLVDAVDEMRGDLDVGLYGVSAPRQLHIMAQAGNADADGSMAHPFNPTSAAGGYAGNPWAQAVAALKAMDISDAPESGRTIVALGGDYGANTITITDADAPWRILCHGQVYVGGAITYTTLAAGSQLATPHLMIAPVGHGALVASGQQLRLGNADGTAWSVFLTECYFGSAAVSGALAAGPLAYLDHCVVDGAFNLPNIGLYLVEQSRINGLTTVNNVRKACNSVFFSITAAAAGAGDDPGFYDCGWEGVPVFTGPAGSALFDPLTRARFVTASGTYASGAGVDDLLLVGDLHSGETDFLVQADSGTLTVATVGANKTLLLQTTNGKIQLNAQDATNGDIDIDAADNVTVDAAGIIDITSSPSAGLYGQLYLEAGVVQLISESAAEPNGDGDIDLQADDQINIDAYQVLWLVGGTSRTNAGTFSASGYYGVWIGGPRMQIGDAVYEHALTNVTFADDAGKVKGTKTGHLMETGLWVRVSGTTNGDGTYRIERINADTFYLMEPLDNSYSAWASFTGADVTGTVTIGHFRSDVTTGFHSSTGSMMFDAGEDVFIAADGTANMAVITGAGDVNISNNGTGKINIQADANDVDISAAGAGNINLTATGDDISLSSSVINIDATAGVSITAGDNVTLDGDFVNAWAPLYSSIGGAAVATTADLARTAVVLSHNGNKTTAPSTAEYTFHSYTLLASALGTKGNKLVGVAYFQTAANPNTKRMSVYVGGVEYCYHSTSVSGGRFRVEFELWRTDTNEVSFWSRWSFNTGKSAPTLEEDTSYEVALTLTSTVNIDIRGTSVTTNTDVCFRGSMLRLEAS